MNESDPERSDLIKCFEALSKKYQNAMQQDVTLEEVKRIFIQLQETKKKLNELDKKNEITV